MGTRRSSVSQAFPPPADTDVKGALNSDVADNPAIQRALRRLRESMTNENHVSHYTKHSSHSVKHSSTW